MKHDSQQVNANINSCTNRDICRIYSSHVFRRVDEHFSHGYSRSGNCVMYVRCAHVLKCWINVAEILRSLLCKWYFVRRKISVTLIIMSWFLVTLIIMSNRVHVECALNDFCRVDIVWKCLSTRFNTCAEHVWVI